jgi:hypothetical protein
MDPVTAIAATKAAYETGKVVMKQIQTAICSKREMIAKGLQSQRPMIQKFKNQLCDSSVSADATFDTIVSVLRESPVFPAPIRRKIEENRVQFIERIKDIKRSKKCTPGAIENEKQFQDTINAMLDVFCAQNRNELLKKVSSYRNVRVKSLAPNTPSMNTTTEPSMSTSMAAPSMNNLKPAFSFGTPNTTSAPAAGGRRKTKRHIKKARKTRRHRRT